MKKNRLTQSIIFILILSVLLNLIPNLMEVSYANSKVEIREWWAYKFGGIKSYEYFSGGSYTNLIGNIKPGKSHSILIPLKIPAKGNNNAKIDIVDTFAAPTAGQVKTDPGKLYLDGNKYNYSLPVKHEYRIDCDDKNTDFFPVWMVAEGTGQTISEERTEELLKLYIERKEALQSLYDTIIRHGFTSESADYHPTHLFFLKSAMEEWDWVLTNGKKDGFSSSLNEIQVKELIYLMDDVFKFIESHRINEAEILDFKLNGYKGIIDKDSKIIELYIPDNVALNREDVEIETPNWVIAKYKSGQIKIGEEAIYTVQPIDIAYHGFIDIPKYDNLKEEWTIKTFKEDENDKLRINSLSYISEYGEKIDGIISENKIELNIPFQVDLNGIELEFYHTGEKAFAITDNNQQIEIEGNKIKSPSIIKEIKITTDNIEKKYDFTIESQSSFKSEILDFRIMIDGISHRANIDNEKNEIEIFVPFSTDITKLKTDIKIDYRSNIRPGAYEVQDFTNPLIYSVTSESGDIRNYKVFVKKGEASSENQILSFRVGTIEGKIEGNNIKVEVPSSVNLKSVKPFIEVSQKAKVKPSSSEEMDFSKGSVDYIVTAEDGEQRIYEVTINHQGKAIGPDEEYMSMLKELRDNIYKKYKEETVSEDWEWMNIGFYEGKNNGLPKGIRKNIDDLPERFNMYDEIGELSSTKITDFARFAMTLTAIGIDASNLEPFQIDGKTFRTDYGRPTGKTITNMIEPLYNASGSGINGAIYSLIVLDMGNYSIPGDANLTRDTLIKVLLNHEYGSDEFGIDMVAMLMQGLYPYQNHPTYGEAVKEKLEYGIELFLGSKFATKVEPLTKEFLGISWSAVNSESTSQAIIALCSMGIDPFSDYRFSRGPEDNMIVNWINKFATPARDGFGHTNNTYNFMGTYQGMYALQWYINFVENGGKPYSLYHDAVPFDFSKEFSRESQITFFELLGKEGDIDHETGEITVTIPGKTPDIKLSTEPIIRIDNGATISPQIGSIEDFRENIIYTVTAEDGKTKQSYRIIVNKKEGVLSGERDIEEIKIRGFSALNTTIDKQNRQISIVLPSHVKQEELKSLVLDIRCSGEYIIPDPKEPQDYSEGEVEYKIIAEDEQESKYTVKVDIEKEAEYKFTKFVLRGVEGEIDTIKKEIIVDFPRDASRVYLRPNEIEFEPDEKNTTLSPGFKPISFDEHEEIYINPDPTKGYEPIKYAVRLNTSIDVGGNGKIAKFSIGDHIAVIEGKSIILEIPKELTKEKFIESLRGKEPKIELSKETITIDPMPENENQNNSLKYETKNALGYKDYEDDYLGDYVLTDNEGNVNLYTVKFIGGSGGTDPDDSDNLEENKIEITSFKVNDIEATIDNGNGRIFLEIPFETENYRVVPTIVLSENTEIYPRIGETIDLRKNNVYTLRKGDIYKQYILIVKRKAPKPATLLWRYMEEDLNIPYYQIVE